jgi:hypothetical protein
MENFIEVPKITSEEYIEIIQHLLARKSPKHPPYFIVCNDVRKLIAPALVITDENKTHDVYYQSNPLFYADMEQGKYVIIDYKQMFEDYCNFFDKHKENSINFSIKHLYNYSKNREKCFCVDYPQDIKMILIIENYNFWDLNSQLLVSKLPETNENIIVICQIRSDFEFAINHIDISAGSRGAWVSLI